MAIMQASPIPLIVTRLDDGDILYANDHLADLIGRSVDELIGCKSPEYSYIPEAREAVVKALGTRFEVEKGAIPESIVASARALVPDHLPKVA